MNEKINLIKKAVSQRVAANNKNLDMYSKPRRYIGFAGGVIKYHKDISKILKNRYLGADYIETIVTTRCSLRCESCCSLMQYYDKPYEVDKSVVIESINRLTENMDWIDCFGVLGGEPFLHHELSEILLHMAGKKNIGHIRITTNGTIFPVDKKVLDIITSDKFVIYISNYGEISRKLKELTAEFDKRGIQYQVLNEDGVWFDLGDMQERDRSDEKLAVQFRNCALGPNGACNSLLNGKLHHCSRSSCGMDLGFVPDNHNDYVDLLNEDRLRGRLLKFFCIDRSLGFYIQACKYCDKCTGDAKSIPAAKQCSLGKSVRNLEKYYTINL